VDARLNKKSLRGAEAFIHGLIKNWVWGCGTDGLGGFEAFPKECLRA
jgi:hypothetical protein